MRQGLLSGTLKAHRWISNHRKRNKNQKRPREEIYYTLRVIIHKIQYRSMKIIIYHDINPGNHKITHALEGKQNC